MQWGSTTCLLLIFVLLQIDFLLQVIRYVKEAILEKSSFHCCVIGLVRLCFGFVGLINVRTRKKVYHLSSRTLIILRGICLITEKSFYIVQKKPLTLVCYVIIRILSSVSHHSSCDCRQGFIGRVPVSWCGLMAHAIYPTSSWLLSLKVLSKTNIDKFIVSKNIVALS